MQQSATAQSVSSHTHSGGPCPAAQRRGHISRGWFADECGPGNLQQDGQEKNGNSYVTGHYVCYTVHLVPFYKCVTKRAKCVERQVKVWDEDSVARLQGCFYCTRTGMFFGIPVIALMNLRML